MVARLIRYYCLAEKLQRSKAIRKKLKFIGEELLIVVAKIHNIFSAAVANFFFLQ